MSAGARLVSEGCSNKRWPFGVSGPFYVAFRAAPAPSLLAHFFFEAYRGSESFFIDALVSEKKRESSQGANLCRPPPSWATFLSSPAPGARRQRTRCRQEKKYTNKKDGVRNLKRMRVDVGLFLLWKGMRSIHTQGMAAHRRKKKRKKEASPQRERLDADRHHRPPSPR